MTTTTHVLERQPGKGIQAQLALDDAFADGDDHPFEFSSAAVRKHLAEQPHWATVDQAAETSAVDEPDTSISTLCLDGSTCGSKSDSASVASCVSQPHTPVDQEPSHLSSSEPEEQAGQRANVLHENGHDREEPPHPMVHIDASKPPSSRVSVITQIDDSAAPSRGAHYPEAPSPTPSALDLPTMTISSLPNGQVSISSPQSHRPSRSTGPTAFQMVVSKTRPHFLPPKNRQEDLKHLADWETMMKQSRVAGDMAHLAIMPLH